MTEKSADTQTFAPRLSHVEDLAEWLKENRGEGGSGDLTDTDKKLWDYTVKFSDNGLSDTPWSATLPYQTYEISLHTAIFGLGDTNLQKVTSKNLFNQLFLPEDIRWSSGSPPYGNSTLSSEVLGVTADGYTSVLRTQGWSLAEAVFGSSSNIGGTRPSIIDKITGLQEQIDEMFEELATLAAYVDEQVERLDERINDLP